MTAQTLIAMYDTAAHADAAVADLKSAGIAPGSIDVHAGTTAPTSTSAPQATWWDKLLGTTPDHDAAVYDRSMASGSTVVTVKVPGEHASQVSTMLEKHNPIDMDERAGSYESATTTTPRTTPAPLSEMPAPATTDGTLQLAEERLAVGKRAVRGGTTRVRSYIVETPVEEQVSLHSETVTLDRRPVTDGRPVSNADFADKTIEMTETNEEAVVQKTARVKEEVSLRKESSDRVETIKDTLRHDEVEVVEVPAEQVGQRGV